MDARAVTRTRRVRHTPTSVSGRLEGTVSIVALSARRQLSAARPRSLMHSNNETGVFQPIRTVAELAAKHGAWLHCDASQSLGKVRATPGFELFGHVL